MATHLEPLNRGIKNAIDDALKQPGHLSKAENARYRVGDQAIWQAEGRTVLGDGVQREASGLNKGGIPLADFLRWNPDSLPNVGENPSQFSELLWGIGAGDTWYTQPLFGAPQSDDNNGTQTFVLNDGTHLPVRVGATAGIKAVPVHNQHNNLYMYVVLNGGEPFVMYRRETRDSAGDLNGVWEQKANLLNYPMGMWLEDRLLTEDGRYTEPNSYNGNGLKPGSIWISPSDGGVTATGSGMPTTGFYQYWATWWNKDLNVEGGAAIGAVTATIAAGNQVDLRIRIGQPAERPKDASHIRIYRSRDAVQWQEYSASLLPFPKGVLVTEIPIAGDDNLVGVGLTYPYITDLGVVDSVDSVFIWYDYGTSSSLYVHDGIYFNAFPTALITVSNQIVEVGRAGPQVNCTTGAVFDASLCTNDVDIPRRLHFSWPGEPHSTPDSFWIDIPARQGDRIVGLETVGQVLLVILTNSIWRINWLPASTEPDFRRGDMLTEVSSSHGMLSRQGSTPFTMPGAGAMIAIAGPDGLIATNGYEIHDMSSEVGWEDLFGNRTVFNSAMLVNNPGEYRLELAIQGDGDSAIETIYLVHYHRSHLGNTGLPAFTGPCRRPGNILTLTACTLDRGEYRTVSTDGTGNILYEWFGFTDGSDGSSLFLDVKTRELYVAGIGKHEFTKSGIAHMKASQFGGGAFSIEYELWPGPRLRTTALTGGERVLTLPELSVDTEYLQIRCRGTAIGEGSAVAVNVVGVEFDQRGPVPRG